MNIQLIKLSLRACFQPDDKKSVTDKLLIFGSESLGFGEVSEEKDKKNGVNDGENEEVDILSKGKEGRFKVKSEVMKLSGSLRNDLVNVFHWWDSRQLYIYVTSEH